MLRTTNYKAAKMIRAAAKGNAYALRNAYQKIGLIPAECREITWYHYAHNGGISRLRAPGRVAGMTRRLAGGNEIGDRASWCGTWGRTRTAERAEREGNRLYRQYADTIAALPLRELAQRIAEIAAQ